MLSKADHEAIAEAVGKAEQGTSGEILCVLARRVSNYRETPLAWGVAAALLLPPIGLALGIRVELGADQDWTGGLIGTNQAVGLALSAYAIAQVVIFAVVSTLVAVLRPLKLVLTPAVIKHRRVRQAARAQLAAARLLGSEIGASVVIYACLEDRTVVVAGDEKIHAKVQDDVWISAVKAVQAGVARGEPASGFVDAVELCGVLMARHFPPDGAPHRLANDILEV